MSEHDYQVTLDPQDEFDDINSAGDLGAAPALQMKPVIVNRWKSQGGKAARFFVWELNGVEHDLYQQEMLKVDGTDLELMLKANTLRLVSFCVRSKTGQRIWPDVDACIETLGQFGQQGLDQIAVVARELNGMDKASRKRAEGKSASS